MPVSPRSRKGTRVVFNASPGSLVLYRNPPDIGEEGTVTTMPGFGTRTFLPGPGGGLLYVRWDNSGTIGVSPRDLDKVVRVSPYGRMRTGAARPGQRFSHGDVEIETTLHPVKGFEGAENDYRPGDVVEIKVRSGGVIRGTVISAENWGSSNSPDWYIEFSRLNERGSYGYWKQSVDGGTVRHLKRR